MEASSVCYGKRERTNTFQPRENFFIIFRRNVYWSTHFLLPTRDPVCLLRSAEGVDSQVRNRILLQAIFGLGQHGLQLQLEVDCLLPQLLVFLLNLLLQVLSLWGAWDTTKWEWRRPVTVLAVITNTKFCNCWTWFFSVQVHRIQNK